MNLKLLLLFVCFLQKEKIRETFVSVLKEEFKGKGLSFSIGESAAAGTPPWLSYLTAMQTAPSFPAACRSLCVRRRSDQL